MKIRVLTVEDTEIYLNLRLEALKQDPESFSASYEDIMSQPDPKTYKAQHLSNKDNIVLGVFMKNELMGVATLETKSLVKQEHTCKVAAVFVSNRARGLGLGKALILACIELAKNMRLEQMTLSVVVGNHGARRLYDSLGFKTFGVLKNSLKFNNQYWDQEHMVLYFNQEMGAVSCY